MRRPRPLELTAADEMIARDHLDVLRQNGFEVEDSGAGDDSDGARLRLVAQPVSKSTTFDMRGGCSPIHRTQRSHVLTQLCRSRGAHPPAARRARWGGGALLEGTRNVCIAGVQEERDDWHAADEKSDDCGKRFGLSARTSPYPVLFAGRSAYGDDGPTLELPSRSSNHAPPHRLSRRKRQGPGSPTRRLGFYISILLSICCGALV